MNEWGFVGEVKSWWDRWLQDNPDTDLDRCELEVAGEAGTRRDIVIWGRGVVRLSGEVRLPDHPRADPWDPDNIENAIRKAEEHHCRWCFTSDATRLLLIDTQRAGTPLNKVVQSFDLLNFGTRNQLDSGAFLVRIQAKWVEVLPRLIPVFLGRVQPAGITPDERFINGLRALLAGPVGAIRDEIERRRSLDPAFERALILWMVDEQGWVHSSDEWEEEIERTAKLAAYVFATRLMFYAALRRSQPTLPALTLADHPATVARAIFETYFTDARLRSGDYETVFANDQAMGYALCADAAIPGWRRVVDHLATFDLAHISYDVAGRLFERLIEPNERHRWGQHYTQPDVVDLMLSFAIPDGHGAVLDPAAGGGTFLVRAYVRKRLLLPELTHQQILEDLYGCEISALAANLATINLAVRNLEFEDNYPRIVLRSFFRLRPHQEVMSLPSPAPVDLGVRGTAPVVLPGIRALASNPPYIALRLLGREQLREAEACLVAPAGGLPIPSKLRGAANYHLFFWLHGAQFLDENGRLVLITSGEWLDSDYGALLQKWLLDNFKIDCFIESMAEPWFTEARVGTVVTVARVCRDENERDNNLVRFVQLRRTLRDLIGESTDDMDHLHRVDALRDRLLILRPPLGESDDLDWSVIAQSHLRALGTRQVVADD